MHWRMNGNPLQCSCLENPRDGGAWWAAVYGVAQSRPRLKRLSSSSNRCVPQALSPFHCVLSKERVDGTVEGSIKSIGNHKPASLGPQTGSLEASLGRLDSTSPRLEAHRVCLSMGWGTVAVLGPRPILSLYLLFLLPNCPSYEGPPSTALNRGIMLISWGVLDPSTQAAP